MVIILVPVLNQQKIDFLFPYMNTLRDLRNAISIHEMYNQDECDYDIKIFGKLRAVNSMVTLNEETDEIHHERLSVCIDGVKFVFEKSEFYDTVTVNGKTVFELDTPLSNFLSVPI